MPFHNPYHFVPVIRRGRPNDMSRADFESGQPASHPHVTHDRYVKDSFSGRILCRLTAETPFVVGSKQTSDPNEIEPTIVEQFELDGYPAIPASSLRGLISAIFEAATNSAMRVLENEAYSFSDWPNGRKNLPDTAHTYFPNEAVPFSAGRQIITIAEQLFGFVEETAELGLAGRIFQSNAILAGRKSASQFLPVTNVRDAYEAGGQDGWTTLKVLSSPKPPSPALYFKTEGNNYISKKEMSRANASPQGRKFYLHKKKESESPWKTSNPDDRRTKHLKMKVRPVAAGTVFFFHVDFYNTSVTELGALLYSLRPSPTFRHKLGLGKPIGLGTVCIDPVAVSLVKRQKRYDSKGLTKDRYETVLTTVEFDPAELPSEYESERLYLPDQNGSGIWNLIDQFGKTIPKHIRNALESIGDPSVEMDVHYPTVKGQGDEGEHFRWFVANDKGSRKGSCFVAAKKKMLRPIDSDSIPTLDEYDWCG